MDKIREDFEMTFRELDFTRDRRNPNKYNTRYVQNRWIGYLAGRTYKEPE